MFYYVTMALLAAAFVFNMFSGGGSARVLRDLFFGHYFAEDAVTDPDDVPNSKEAISKCIAAGMGIKTEVYAAKDGRPVISAYNDLSRQYGIDKKIGDYAADELGDTVMTATQLIEMVDGRVPVILELKSGDNNEMMCRHVADAIKASGHSNIAVASFHSGIIAWFRQKEKKLFRGLISAPAKDFTSLSKWERFLTGNMCNNSVARPQFVLYRNKKHSVFVKLAFASGVVKGVWLITDKENGKALEETNDIIICRGFIPEQPQYKELGEREKTQIELDIEEKEARKAARRQAKAEFKAQQSQQAQGAPLTAREKAIAAGYIEEDSENQVTEYVEESEATAATETTEE